jgi:hypothetical protein
MSANARTAVTARGSKGNQSQPCLPSAELDSALVVAARSRLRRLPKHFFRNGVTLCKLETPQQISHHLGTARIVAVIRISAVIRPDIKRGFQDWHGDCCSLIDDVPSDTVKEVQMNAKLVKLLLPCAAIGAIVIGPAALAQAPAAPPPAPPAVAPPPAPPAGGYYSNQLLETRGTVQRFTLTPIGELDGVILTDGTEVHLPPHLTTQLASAVRIGDTVAVQGYRSPSVSLVVASSITDTNTGQTVDDNGRHLRAFGRHRRRPACRRLGRSKRRFKARCKDHSTVPPVMSTVSCSRTALSCESVRGRPTKSHPC